MDGPSTMDGKIGAMDAFFTKKKHKKTELELMFEHFESGT